jgi:hypothetical protein
MNPDSEEGKSVVVGPNGTLNASAEPRVPQTWEKESDIIRFSRACWKDPAPTEIPE